MRIKRKEGKTVFLKKGNWNFLKMKNIFEDEKKIKIRIMFTKSKVKNGKKKLRREQWLKK